MRKYILYFGAIISSFLFFGCRADEPIDEFEPSGDSEIRIRVTEHSIDASGGEIKVAYALMNGGDEPMTISKGESEYWLECEIQDSHIVITVEGNIDGQNRGGHVVLSHPRAEDVTLTINQSGYEGDIIKCWAENINPTDAIFYWDCELDNMYVVGMVRPVSYFKDNNITTAKDLFEHDENLSHAYSGKNAFERFYSTGWMFQNRDFEYMLQLYPTVQYVVYAYGVEFSQDKEECVMITDVCYEIVTMPEITDNGVRLEADLTIDGAKLIADVRTNGYSGAYDIVLFAEGDSSAPLYLPEGTEPDQLYYNNIARYFNVEWYNLMYLNSMTVDQVMDSYLTGDYHYETHLWPERNYTVALFTIDRENERPVLTSIPTLYHITTGEPTSNLTIDFEVSNINAHGCDFKIIPSNDEDTYAYHHVKTSEIEGMTDDEIIQYLFDVKHAIPWHTGERAFTNADLYLPDTEYSILAFGGANVQGNVLDGYATTPLFRYDYRTLEAVPANNRITNIEIFGPYYYYDILEKYPDFEFAMSVTFATIYCWKITTENDDVAHIESMLFSAGTAEHLGYDDAWTFTMAPIKSYCYGSSNYNELEVCAILKDSNGNYSELYVSEPISVNKQEMRDPSEFMEIVSSYQW